MINGYFMMKSIEKNRFPNDNLGISTIRFIANKFKSLFPYLLPAIIMSYIVSCISVNRPLFDSARIFSLTFFDLFPLNMAGFDGNYPVGISWYLSGMFLALAILYPLAKKFSSNFTLCVCPVAALLIYGWMSHTYGNLAVIDNYTAGAFFAPGLLRAIAGCSVGCVLYEATKRFEAKKVKNSWKSVFTIIEISLCAFICYVMHHYPTSKYDYVALFAILLMLFIGISGLSYSSDLCRGKWTSKLNSWSLMLMLNHARLAICLRLILGKDYINTNKIWIFFGLVLITSVICKVVGELIKRLMKRISDAPFFVKDDINDK
ncbi:MAG: acyltransferase family protein, partial [Ruminiclostridium sp.]|nr:acyltransferase family protein [Ruminiclostridium sp.]